MNQLNEQIAENEITINILMNGDIILTMQLSVMTKLHDIKNRIKDECGIISDMILKFNNIVLQNHNTLNYYDLPDNVEITLSLCHLSGSVVV